MYKTFKITCNPDHMLIDLGPLLKYYELLFEIVDQAIPKISEINEETRMPNINYSHPEWVRAYFPLNMIFYRENAGKVRNVKNPVTADMNNNSVATCVIYSCDDFGIITRRMKHYGYKRIVGAMEIRASDIDFAYSDWAKPKRFKNFAEFARCYDLEDAVLSSMGNVLDRLYPCNATGQLRIF